MHSLVVLATSAAVDGDCPARIASGQEPLLGRSLLEHALELGAASGCSRGFVWSDAKGLEPVETSLPVSSGSEPASWLEEFAAGCSPGIDALVIGVARPLLESDSLARSAPASGDAHAPVSLVDAGGRTIALRVPVERLVQEWKNGAASGTLDALAERVGVVRQVTVEGPQSFLVHDFESLCEASENLRSRLVAELLRRGVRIDHPESTYVECGARIEPGAHIEPFSVIRRGVHIGAECTVGPFAHLRPGTRLEAGASVGNFVELKAARLGRGAKARHLSYVGDADVGEAANLGAGTIFANYDGKAKHRTVVKARAFVGSGSILVAPVTIGEGATTGAGSVVLRGRDVADGDVVAGVPARSLKPKG